MPPNHYNIGQKMFLQRLSKYLHPLYCNSVDLVQTHLWQEPREAKRNYQSPNSWRTRGSKFWDRSTIQIWYVLFFWEKLWSVRVCVCVFVLVADKECLTHERSDETKARATLTVRAPQGDNTQRPHRIYIAPGLIQCTCIKQFQGPICMTAGLPHIHPV